MVHGTSLCFGQTAKKRLDGTAIFNQSRSAPEKYNRIAGAEKCPMVNVSMIPVFVHFPHPGDEHNPGNVRRQPWNTGNHRRKFLRSDGRYVAEDGSLYDASLVFWGEWEAPSYIVDCWLPEGRLPRFLHEPVWERP